MRKWVDILIIILSTVFVVLSGWHEVELVGDISTVPSGLAALPRPFLPDLSLVPALLGGAVAAVVVVLAESSGAGAAYPNPDNSRSSMSGDFIGQGLGNFAGSFFQAMPAGGSLSRTGLNASGGARSRWAGVYAGVLIALTLVLFGHYAELIPMTGLSALLIVIGFRARERQIASLTGLDWFRQYAVKLRETGDLFIVSDVEPDLMEILEKTEAVEITGKENIFPAEPGLFASTEKAISAAQAWIKQK